MIRGFSFISRLKKAAQNGSAKKKERAKAKLLAATCDALEDIQNSELRVSDIAKRADVSHGLFYHYFRDRHAAVVELISGFLMQLQQDATSLPKDKDTTPFVRIFSENFLYIDCCLANQQIFKVLITDGFRYPEVKEMYAMASRDWSQRIAGSLIKGDTDSKLSNDLITVQGYCLSGMIDDLMRQAIVVETPGLRRFKDAPVLLTEAISVLWYRAVYGKEPPTEDIDIACKKASDLIYNTQIRS